MKFCTECERPAVVVLENDDVQLCADHAERLCRRIRYQVK